MLNRRLFQFMFLLAVLVSSTSRADILVSNLDEPFRADTPIANPQYWAAQSFFTDASSYSLESIAAIVGNGSGAPLIVAELRAATGMSGDIDMSAGGLLGTFFAPDVSGPTSARTFIPNSSITLAPSTQYWFVLGSDNAGTFDWSYANTNFFSGPGFLGSYADSSDAGATWNYGQLFPYFMQVNTAAVPEPTLLPLLGVALGFLTLNVRRRA